MHYRLNPAALLSFILLTGCSGHPPTTAMKDEADTNGLWQVQIGGANADAVYGLAATDDGRACLTGTFISVVDFGTQSHPVQLDSGGYSDIFVACYGRDGTPAFASHFGVTQKNDQPRAIAALPGGDVLVTGYFSNTFGVEPGPVLSAPGHANADAFLVRVDSRGGTVWARGLGGQKADSGRALAVDAEGNILLAGSFQGAVPYTERGVGRKLTTAGGSDGFVMKLDSNGEMLWARRFGGTGTDEAFAVAVATDGTVVVAGTFAGEASADGMTPVASSGYNDVFVGGLTPTGEWQWTTAFGGDGQEYVGGLVAVDDGDLWLAGSFQREIVFTGGEKLTSAGSTDAFLVRLDSGGGFDRVLSFGGADVELIYGIAAMDDGSLLATGHFQNQADLAPGPAERIYRSSGVNDTDGFVLALDREGAHRHAIVLGGNDVAIGNAVVAIDQRAVVTGLFGKTISLGQDGLILESRGKNDIFVAQFVF